MNSKIEICHFHIEWCAADGKMQDGKLEWSTSYYTVHYLKYRSQCDIRELLQKLREYWLPFTHQSDVRSGWRIFESGFVRADAASDRECHRESECHVLDCSIRSLRSGIKDPWKCDTRQNPILGTVCLLTIRNVSVVGLVWSHTSVCFEIYYFLSLTL